MMMEQLQNNEGIAQLAKEVQKVSIATFNRNLISKIYIVE